MEFIERVDHEFGEIIEDADAERTATAVLYFNPAEPTVGDADDRSRHMDASGQAFFNAELPVYDQNGLNDPQGASDNEQRYFAAPRAQERDDASDMKRTALGSEQRYQELTEAAVSQNNGLNTREREGTAQEFYQREPARFDKISNDASAVGTQQEFFKQDEAYRGDITDQDEFINGTQENWINRGNASQGKPDDFNRSNKGDGIAYHNKSDMGGRANGPATPHQDMTDVN